MRVISAAIVGMVGVSATNPFFRLSVPASAVPRSDEGCVITAPESQTLTGKDKVNYEVYCEEGGEYNVHFDYSSNLAMQAKKGLKACYKKKCSKFATVEGEESGDFTVKFKEGTKNLQFSTKDKGFDLTLADVTLVKVTDDPTMEPTSDPTKTPDECDGEADFELAVKKKQKTKKGKIEVVETDSTDDSTYQFITKADKFSKAAVTFSKVKPVCAAGEAVSSGDIVSGYYEVSIGYRASAADCSFTLNGDDVTLSDSVFTLADGEDVSSEIFYTEPITWMAQSKAKKNNVKIADFACVTAITGINFVAVEDPTTHDPTAYVAETFDPTADPTSAQ